MLVDKPRRVKSQKTKAATRADRCAVFGCRRISDAAHVRSRGAGGGDEPGNLLPLCRNHHIEQHAHGWKRFLAAYPNVTVDLLDRGWRLAETSPGLWKLQRS